MITLLRVTRPRLPGRIALAWKVSALVLLMALLIPHHAPAARAQSPLALGNSNGDFVVPGILDQFNALKHHGEAVAAILPKGDGAPDPSLYDHYQGVARYPGAGTPVFYITQSDDDDPIEYGAHGVGGYLHVFSLPTRPADGERMRSNVQAYGSDTKYTAPPQEDRWRRSLRFDGRIWIDGQRLPAYKHPGGVAVVDDILFMALDAPSEAEAPAGQIVLFDLSVDRERPLPIQNLPLNHKIDNLAVARQADGTFLIWANGDGGGQTKFYTTSGADLRAEGLMITLVQNWNHGSSADYDGNGNGWPGTELVFGGEKAHQGSTFVRDNDGVLYLIGTRHDGVGNYGSDHADLYRVDPKPEGGFKLTRIRSREFHCVYKMSSGTLDTDGRICNFIAAAAAYASPTGELFLYSTPHDEDGDGVQYVRIAEFRHRDVSREDSPLRQTRAFVEGIYTSAEGGTAVLSGVGLPSADRPWIELYDDHDWDDRSIMVDYDDRHLFELDNFGNLDDFGDRPTSMRWRLPVGLDVVLFEDDTFRGRHVFLRGTGRTETIASIGSQRVVPGVVEQTGISAGEELEFGDASSMAFIGAPPEDPVSMEWDLDGDFSFGEVGTGAGHGDETGARVTFQVGDVDGPVVYPVFFRASSRSGAAQVAVSVQIYNVGPSAEFSASSGAVIAGETAGVRFTNQWDPSRADRAAGFTYGYDCTDGGVFELSEATTSEYACRFSGGGSYTVRGQIFDKDQGRRTYTVTVTVLSAAEAIDELVVLVESFNLHRGIDNALDSKLQAALHAVSELESNNVGAAITALRDFVSAVEAQREKKISAEQADQLIGLAQRIITSLQQS